MKRVLFLQGPVGPFFARLATEFEACGAKTFTIGFNLGDWVFAKKQNFFFFNGLFPGWEQYLGDFIEANQITHVFLFGDCRPFHRVAVAVCGRMSVPVYVFEEGYVRPNYITLEKNGVNGFSGLPSTRSFYESISVGEREPSSGNPPSWVFLKTAIWTTIYYNALTFGMPFFPHYRHHRNGNSGLELLIALRNFWRKIWFKWQERTLRSQLSGALSNRYFLAVLQTASDYQIKVHSSFVSTEEYIKTVMISFAKSAPKGDLLIFKHHPLDRGRRLFDGLIDELAMELGIAGRVFSTHDVHLPTMLRNAKGVVTINSTAGLSALMHRRPVIALGKAIYNIEGLTCVDKSLEEFWLHPEPPQEVLLENFVGYVIKSTQISGSFYAGFPEELRQPCRLPAFL